MCALFTALPKLHVAKLANQESERFDLSGVRENLRVFDDDLLAMGKQFRVLFLQRRVLLVQQRLEFRNAHPVEIGKLNARSIHYVNCKDAAYIVNVSR